MIALRAFLKQFGLVVFVHRLVLGLPSYLSFLIYASGGLSIGERFRLITRVHRISRRLVCAHDETEAMAMIQSILELPPELEGVIVEAGCFQGGSAAKLSLAAQLTGRTLVLCDSFEGIPDNDESHGPSGHQGPLAFEKGTFAGRLEEVRANITEHGEIGQCEFVKGWFDETLPQFRQPIAMIFLDVDLATSTRTCLRYLYPLLQPGCVLYSHDAAFPRVREVFADEPFWRDVVGAPMPTVEARFSSTMIRIRKAGSR